MATSKGDLFGELEEIMACALCLERCKEPRSLPCLHAFCLSCLKQLVDKSGQSGIFNCPSCRSKVHVPSGGADTFPRAFLWNAISETVDKFKGLGLDKKAKCTVCLQDGKQTDATKLCVDCMTTLCADCLVSHNKFQKLSNHNLLECSNIKPGDLNNILKNKTEKCKEHSMDIELFCENCSELLCTICGMLGHKGHKKQSVAKVVGIHRAGLEHINDQMSKRVDHYEQCRQKIDKTLKNCHSEMQAKIKTLEQHGDKVIQQVRKCVKQLRSEMEVKTAWSIKQLEPLKWTLDEEMSRLISCEEQIRMLIKHGNSSTVINTSVKEKQMYENLLRDLQPNHKLPLLTFNLNLTDVNQLTAQSVLGTVHILEHEEPLKEDKAITGQTAESAGQAAAKVTVKTTGTGVVSISECAADGSYITLRDKGWTFSRSGWSIERTIDGQKIVNVNLPNFMSRKKSRLFARGKKPIHPEPGYKDFECCIDSWGTGDNIITTLYNNCGLKKVTHTKTTEYTS